MKRLRIASIVCAAVLFVVAISILLYTKSLIGLLFVSPALVLLALTYTVPSRQR